MTKHPQQMDKEQIRISISKVKGLPGMTVNERLYLTGLMDEFDTWKLILQSLGADEISIKRTLMIK